MQIYSLSNCYSVLSPIGCCCATSSFLHYRCLHPGSCNCGTLACCCHCEEQRLLVHYRSLHGYSDESLNPSIVRGLPWLCRHLGDYTHFRSNCEYPCGTWFICGQLTFCCEDTGSGLLSCSTGCFTVLPAVAWARHRNGSIVSKKCQSYILHWPHVVVLPDCACCWDHSSPLAGPNSKACCAEGTSLTQHLTTVQVQLSVSPSCHAPTV